MWLGSRLTYVRSKLNLVPIGQKIKVDKSTLKTNQFFIHKKRDYSGRVLTPLKKREPTSSTFYLVASDEERHDLFGIANDGRNIYDFVHSDDIEPYTTRQKTDNPQIETIQLLEAIITDKKGEQVPDVSSIRFDERVSCLEKDKKDDTNQFTVKITILPRFKGHVACNEPPGEMTFINDLYNISFDDDFISTLAFDVMVRLETNMPMELRITKMAFSLETDDTVKRVEVKLKSRPTRFPRQHRQHRLRDMNLSRNNALQFTNRLLIPEFSTLTPNPSKNTASKKPSMLPSVSGEFEFKPVLARPSTRQNPLRYRAKMPTCYLSEDQIVV